MPDISEISKAIERKKKPEVLMPEYVTGMAGLYNRLSSIRLAMNYYMFREFMEDCTEQERQQLGDLPDRLDGVIRRGVLDGRQADAKQELEKLDGLRAELISAMEIVTAYVDRLAIYEHILNRVEFRFSDEKFDENYYENGFTNDIMHYILEKSDAAITNSRICEIVSQLPMRLTRQKFFELLKDAFSLYRGSDLSSLQDFSYMIKTLSGIYEPEGFQDRLPEVRELYAILVNADYSVTDRSDYERLSDTLRVAAEQVTGLSDLYVSMMELVNDAYIILLTGRYAIVDHDERENCRFIIREVMGTDSGRDSEEDINDCFISLEGHQERICRQISENDYIIDTVLDNMQDTAASLNILEDFRMLRKCVRLSSGSHFAALEETVSGRKAEEEDINAAFGEIGSCLQERFKNQPVAVNRAIMAIVLGNLPVFFNNVDEIQTYINVSLSQCRDRAERMACVSLVRMIFDEA